MSRWCLFVLSSLVAANAIAADPQRVVKVSAKSELHVPPNLAVLQVSVATEDKQLLAAKDENDQKTMAMFEALQSLTIPHDQITVTDLDVMPMYSDRYRRSVETLTGYQFVRRIEIRIGDLSLVEGVLAECLGKGANHIDRLEFRTTRNREHQFEARAKAVEHAREKATHLAEVAGMKLGPAISIHEGVEYNPATEGFGGFAGATAGIPKAAIPVVRTPETTVRVPVALVSLAQAAAPPNAVHKDRVATAVAPGLLRISAEVTMEFELLPKP